MTEMAILSADRYACMCTRVLHRRTCCLFNQRGSVLTGCGREHLTRCSCFWTFYCYEVCFFQAQQDLDKHAIKDPYTLLFEAWSFHGFDPVVVVCKTWRAGRGSGRTFTRESGKSCCCLLSILCLCGICVSVGFHVVYWGSRCQRTVDQALANFNAVTRAAFQ